MAIAKINYLGQINTNTGKAHEGWAGGRQYDGRTASVRSVPSICVTIPDMSVDVSVGWGDRDEPNKLPVWTSEDSNGISASYSDRYGKDELVVYKDKYPIEDKKPEWLDNFIVAVNLIRLAAIEAEANNPDILEVCNSYRKIVQGIKIEHENHYKQWKVDAQKIAKAFRRKSVEVGEQTVPGKLCVRSSRGRLLGYADCWDGKWLGSIERV